MDAGKRPLEGDKEHQDEYVRQNNALVFGCIQMVHKKRGNGNILD